MAVALEVVVVSEGHLAQPPDFGELRIGRAEVRQVAEALLHGTVDANTTPGRPRGCLLVQSALACGPEGESVRRDLAGRREAAVDALRARFAQAQADGDLPPKVDPDSLARYLTVVAHGISVQAAGGASREDLHRAADQALSMWPST